MKNKNKTESIDQNRSHKRDEKHKTPDHNTHRVSDESRGVKEEHRTSHSRGYYSRNGGHGGYNGL